MDDGRTDGRRAADRSDDVEDDLRFDMPARHRRSGAARDVRSVASTDVLFGIAAESDNASPNRRDRWTRTQISLCLAGARSSASWPIVARRLATARRSSQGAGRRKQKQAPRHTNRLAKETSPYLLLHAHNPVDWYPWGEEALAKAKAEKKLIFLSIGYSSCYWCHVMERESFMDDGDRRAS